MAAVVVCNPRSLAALSSRLCRTTFCSHNRSFCIEQHQKVYPHSRSARLHGLLKRELSVHGLGEIVEPIDLSLYNSHPKIQHNQYNPDLPIKVPSYFQECSLSDISQVTSFLIGNTAAIWEHFIRHLQSNPERNLYEQPHPFDHYVQSSINNALLRALKTFSDGSDLPTYEIRWVMDTHPSRVVSMQTASHVCGLAPLHSASQLCVHQETFGPWIAFRALLMVDVTVDWPQRTEEGETIGNVMNGEAGGMLLEAELEDQVSDLLKSALSEPGDWRRWLAIRECISESQEKWEKHKYCDTMIEYHYSKHRNMLEELCKV